MRFDHRVVDVAARKYLGERVTNEFAHAQLARRRIRRLVAMLTMTGHLYNVVPRFNSVPGHENPGTHLILAIGNLVA
jgi:hypothetical protein